AAVGAGGELGRAEPVGERQLGAVVQAEAPLLGGVHQEQPAEGPERLPAQGGRWFGVQHDDPLPPAGELSGRNQAGQASADHDDVGVGHGGSLLARAGPASSWWCIQRARYSRRLSSGTSMVDPACTSPPACGRSQTESQHSSSSMAPALVSVTPTGLVAPLSTTSTSPG